MPNSIIKSLTVLSIAAFTAGSASGAADHLLITEVGIAPEAQVEGFSSEYIEIYNPTADPIPLGTYYISDHNDYRFLPTSPPQGLNGGNTDNLLKFPADAVLQPGQVAVVTGGGNNFMNAHFGGRLTYEDFRNLEGKPLLFEVGETVGAIPNMTYFNTGGLASNFNFTNPSETNGEFVVLFHWDGASDLVQDVDIVAWGNNATTNRFAPKTTADKGANETPYLADAGSHDDLSVGNTGFALISRIGLTETAEVSSGGNGITGHDETTEDASVTWVGGVFGANETPGFFEYAVASARPIIASAVRDVQYPAPGAPVTLSANVSDSDGTIQAVTFHVRTDDTFSTVIATEGAAGVWTAMVGPFPNETVVDYYVEAIDNTGSRSLYPQYAPAKLEGFQVTTELIADGDLIINEIFHDNPGADTYEFVEFYNTRNEPLDLSYFRFTDAGLNYGILPRGAVIPANGYLVVSQGADLLLENFTAQPGVGYYDWGSLALNQGGDTVRIAHANEFGTASNPATTFIEQVIYQTSGEWPSGYGGSLRSMELKHPSLDNNVGGNWAEAIEKATPGTKNTVYAEGPVIVRVTRNVEFPAPGAPITINAEVTVPGSGTIASVSVMVDAGTASFVEIPMTTAGNPSEYTAQLPGYPEGTIVRYYVKAVDNGSVSTNSPLAAPNEFHVFLVNADPASSEDLVINEILYDNIGGDAYEYVEIYNRRDSAISLAYFRIGDGTSNHLEFPADAQIPGNGYVVVTQNIEAFNMQYLLPAGVPLYQAPFTLNNPSDRVYIAHPNSIDFNGQTTFLDELTYNNVAPWPEIDANVTGQSIELYSPELDNSQGQNWGAAVIVGPYPGSGTPGQKNTAEPSNVADWNLY